MDFELTKEQEMFRNMARDFVKREVIHEELREYDRQEKYNIDLHRKMGKAGFLGFLFPKEYGGLGMDYVTATVVAEELAKGEYYCGSALGAVGLYGTPIAVAGTDEQKKKYLPSLISGEKIFCTASNEANAGTDGGAIETIAVLDGNEWMINGTKTFIARAGVADVIQVFAQTEKGKGYAGQGVFIVDRDTPGVHITPIVNLMGQRYAAHANIRFVDCRIPKENLMGEIGTGLRLVQTGISDMRWGIATASVGMAQDCLDRCVEYVKQRHQFGRPIASFQLVQEMLAEMAIQIEAARYLVYHLAWLKDKGMRHRKETSMAKIFATEMAMRIPGIAMHIYGGYGLTDDLPFEQRYRTAPLPAIYGGTTEVHKLTIGRELTGINAMY
ncbi:acyl-CoA dehydrogenase family protein [Chloroflexota bacterium]